MTRNLEERLESRSITIESQKEIQFRKVPILTFKEE